MPAIRKVSALAGEWVVPPTVALADFSRGTSRRSMARVTSRDKEAKPEGAAVLKGWPPGERHC